MSKAIIIFFFVLSSLGKTGNSLHERMAAHSVWSVRWLYLSIVKTVGQNGKQFLILDLHHQSKRYLVMIGDLKVPRPETSPIHLHRKTGKKILCSK